MSEELIFSFNTTNEPEYGRSSSNIQRQLEQEISNLYGGNSVCVCSSGLNSIDILLHSIFISNKWKPYNIICGDELYNETPILFDYFKTNYGAINDIHEIDVSYDSKILGLFEKIKDTDTILFLESCSNPNGYIFNWDLIPKIRALCKNIIIIIDNSWLTGVIFNPFNVGVDYVIASTTKYYSGSKCIGGFIVGTQMECVSDWINIHGTHVSPHNCGLILDALHTLQERMSNDNVLSIANFLEQHEKVLECNYPLLENHKSYSIAKKYWTKDYYPQVLTFSLDGMTILDAQEWQNSQTIINNKTSYGGSDSRFNPWPGEVRTANDEGIFHKAIIRLSVGYEDSDELVNKLGNSLKKI